MLSEETTISQPAESSSLPAIGRRKALGTISIALASLFASTQSSIAWSFKWKRRVEIDFSRLPDEWVRHQGRNVKAYAKYVSKLKLQKISTQDVISAHAKRRGHVWNSLPPRRWWKRMGNTLQVVDNIAIEMDTPVKDIISAYRSPTYNAYCAGAKRGSWHQANVAVDVKFGVSPRHAAKVARHIRKRGLFKGGVGSYSTFTHIDTRGSNADW